MSVCVYTPVLGVCPCMCGHFQATAHIQRPEDGFCFCMSILFGTRTLVHHCMCLAHMLAHMSLACPCSDFSIGELGVVFTAVPGFLIVSVNLNSVLHI